MNRRIVGPFNRVEGDLEVRLEIEDTHVRSAYVTSTLYRGFEQMLRGKDPRDALVISPRICGICSVSQSVSAAAALADAQGIEMPSNGRLVSNLIHATENIADHITHFYMFFMPDFASKAYANEAWFDWVEERFKAVQGTASFEILPARAEFMHVLGVLAGKWPHTLTIQPGGSTKSVAPHEIARLLGTLSAFRRFLETTVFGDELEAVTALSTREDLQTWASREQTSRGDLRKFLYLSAQLDLSQLGNASEHYLSYGAYQLDTGSEFARGVFENGAVTSFDPAVVVEDVASTWSGDRSKPRHPFDGVTDPDADAAGGYSWCKAPRLDGQVVEVGALARQLVDGHPLIRDVVAREGGSVFARVLARLVEIARIVPLMEDWVRAIVPGEPFCVHGIMPDIGEGAGLVEAARGSLGHWLKIKDGAIENYQIVAPTTWNFSPRDSNGTPGALEKAIEGAPIRPGEEDPISVQHIVRSFDPCMVCTVH